MAGLKSTSEKELIQLLSNGSHVAYTEIYHRYFHLIYTHAFKKLLDEDQAKDIVQEVFAGLWFKRESAQNIKDLAAYLFSAVRNKVFDLYAHQQVKHKHLESLTEFLSSNPIVSSDHHIREAQFKAYIDQQIANLPPRMRQIFELSRKEDFTYKEIADQLSTTENNVSKHINSALRILKTKLGVVAGLLILLK